MARKVDKTVGFNNLPLDRQRVVTRERETANDKLPKNIEDIKGQISLVFTEADGFGLFHAGSKQTIGHISHRYTGNGNVVVDDIRIDQSYQQYGFSALLLGLFYEKGLDKLKGLTGKDIPKELTLEVNGGREKVMQHVASKYFKTNEGGILVDPDMDAIYASIAQKTQNPHTDFDNAQFIV